MLREVREAARLRLREGRDFPVELLVCPLLVLLYSSRYPRYAAARGCWLCSCCGGPIQGGKHMALHTCRKPNRPRWLKADMQQQGALDDRGRCKLCAKPVGERAHVCSSPLVCSFVADFSALYEPWHGFGQEEFAGLRRLQGQVVVVMPEAAHFEQPAQALQTGELMLFQGVVAMSHVVAAAQQLEQGAARLLQLSGGDEDAAGDEPLQGRGLGLYTLLPLQAEDALPASYERRPGHPRAQQTWVCPYSGWLGEGGDEAEDALSTMAVRRWSCPKAAAVQPASEGGVAVLVNCAHGERANADTIIVWRRDLGCRIPYIQAVRESPAGSEVLYDYRAVTSDVAEYNSLRLNPACGCGCGGRLLAFKQS